VKQPAAKDVMEVQRLFVEANQAGEYLAVRERAYEYFEAAMRAGEPNLGAALVLIAAESAYFISTSPEVPPENRARALLTSLTELAGLPAWPFEEGSPGWGGRYASLATTVAKLSLRYAWPEEERWRVIAQVTQLAGKLDRAIPPGVEIRLPLERGNDVIAELARLSCNFGDAAVALERAATLQQLSISQKDLAGVMVAQILGLHAARRAGNTKAHDMAYQSLAAHINGARDRRRSRVGRLFLASRLDSVVANAMEEPLLHAQRDARDVFDVVELVKARLLNDNMEAPSKPMATAEARTAAQALESQIMRFAPRSEEAKSIIELSEVPLVSQLPVFIFDPESGSTQAANIQRVEAMFAEADAGYGASAKPARADEVMALLNDDELLVEYFLPYEDLAPSGTIIIIVLSKSEARTMTVHSPEAGGERSRIATDGSSPLDLSMYTRTIARFRAAIRQEDVEATELLARDVYDWLIAPVVALGFDPSKFVRWIIVPHSVFHAVPFAALRSPEGRYLIESVGLTTVPSAAVWTRLASAARQALSSLLVVENPSLNDASLPDLREAAREVKRVRAATAKLAQMYLDGPRATESAVRDALPGKGIVHIAAHGEFPELDALDLHRIRLAPDPTNDGRLHAEEVRTLDMHATRLFVLSACDGSIYRFGPGDEPYGLMPALFAAGVENILGALWPMHDELGTEFMIELYKNVLATSVSEAVRRTCLTFIADGAKPIYWAGFTLSGPGRYIG
jgi:CHAT domain-containing protein